MDTRTAEAFFFRDDHRVCGLRLRPLTLRLWLRVEALVPGILDQSRPADLFSLWISAQILAGREKLRPLPLRSLAWSLDRHLSAWLCYCHDHQSPPRYWHRPSDGPPRKVPWQLASAVYVAKGTATPVDAVLDMPVSQFWWWQAALAEGETPRDRPSPIIAEADEAEMEIERDLDPIPDAVLADYRAWLASVGHAQEETP